YMYPQYPQQAYPQPNMNMDYQQPFPQQPYIYPQYPQQPYMQPQQSIHIDNIAPYQTNPQNPSQNSVHNSQHIPESTVSDVNLDVHTDSEQSIMAKKLANLINDSSMASGVDNQPQNTQRSSEISKEEMIKRANQEKKAAKGGFFGKR
ncbi:MAG: hypothetical protein K2G83_07705, partial [Ruminococcus sp.]|nr:hypothetical protein [Ruminococcus sp.]